MTEEMIDMERVSEDLIIGVGIQSLTITAAELKDGANYKYIALTLKDAEGIALWSNLSLAPNTRFKVEEFLDAIGAPAQGQVPPSKFVGRPVRVDVFHEDYNGRPQARVRTWIAAGVTTPAAAPTPAPAQTEVPTNTPTELGGSNDGWDVPF